MRLRIVLLLLFGALALVVGGCGGGEEAAPLPDEVEGTIPAEEEPEEPAEPEEPVDEEEGDAGRGHDVFLSAGCGGCHTHGEAGTTGTVGVDFDEVDTDFEEAVVVIRNGRGAMPAFGDQLSEQEVRDVAAFVSDS